MSILVDNDTRLLVQGITGSQGAFHAEQMIQYGTKVVAGAVPGRGGQWAVGNTPVFDTVHEAVATTDANTSIIFVPAAFAVDALLEAADAGVALIVCITENIPALDMARARAYLDSTESLLIGPNCPGLISPGSAKVGIMAGHIHTPGNVGIVSRSGTLTYEVIYALTERGIGQSTAVGIGGDPIKGLNFLDVLQMFEQDSATEQVVLIGEIGGTDEQVAADYIRTEMSKPVTAFIAGQTAPPGKRMGHAGAIISGGEGTAAEKIEALQAAGVAIARHPEEIAELAAQNI
ncbi:MAG: succinate--CoA ligase subunit alpha [Caldilineaceae bacterium SB0668_bin_21]|nr:succinate--CoA ligase subunit alpha [Caldilineaceae bacterium]MXX24594.1 succinate--CoA ligase subunit alpha [Caldilineaceae bacterium SB0668_bin_21]MYC23156.1 succinate--CoA ligase subunit alpha [Caldilineaceae bacterium SB0662_bin_25]